MNNPDQPINPVTTYKTDGDKIVTENFSGLTKREYIAGLAMQANLTNIGCNRWNEQKVAERSVAYADALLKQLSNPQIK